MLDELIYNYDTKRLANIRNEFVNIKKNFMHQNLYHSLDLIEQYESFLLGIEYYNTHLFHESISVLTSGIQKRNRLFKLSCWQNFKYSLLEVRMLLLIALSHSEIGNLDLSNDLLKFCSSSLLSTIDSDFSDVYILIKIYYNLSYNSHLSDQNESALKYANSGIEICHKFNTNYCLSYLLMRKGVAEFLLGDSAFIISFKTGILLLELFDDQDIADTFRKIIKEKYDINL